jgi:hypothetical protein
MNDLQILKAADYLYWVRTCLYQGRVAKFGRCLARARAGSAKLSGKLLVPEINIDANGGPGWQ